MNPFIDDTGPSYEDLEELIEQLRAELARVTAERDTWADRDAQKFVELLMVKEQRDQAIREGDEAADRILGLLALADRVEAQKQRALQLIGYWRDEMFEDSRLASWHERASDTSKPWPTDAETQEILNGK